MINILYMLAGFCLFTGISMFYYKFTRSASVESMGLAVFTIILVQLVFGMAGNITIGNDILYVVGFAGIILFFSPVRRQKRKRDFFSLGFLLVVLGFLYTLVAFRKAVIQNTDEFIQWAKAARYVYETGLLPSGGMFSGTLPPGTTLFHNFFIRLTGYVESNLYCSGFLLTWIGLMLPVSTLRWKEWKKVLSYSALVFLALYVLYIYPYMSIYVDMPTAVWAGGFLALWYLKEDKKDLRLLLGAVLFMVPLFKWAVGFILAAGLLLFILVIHATQSTLPVKLRLQAMRAQFKGKTAWMYLVLPFCAVLSLLIWAIAASRQISLLPSINGAAVNDLIAQASDRARLTIDAGITAAFNKNLGVSGLNVTYFSFMAAAAVTAVVLYFLSDARRKSYRWVAAFYVLGAVAYFFILMLNYLNTFSYNESIRVACIYRYFSIYVFFGLPVIVSPIMTDHPKKKIRILKAVFSLILIAVLCLGLNRTYFTKYFMIRSETQIAHYADIKNIRDTSAKILKIVPAKSKILFVAQNTNGYEVSVASYATYSRVQNPLGGVFDFTEETRDNLYQTTNSPPVAQIGKYMMDMHYDYLWVYKTNAYFNKNAGKALNTSIQKGGLYKIERVDGEKAKAELIQVFK